MNQRLILFLFFFGLLLVGCSSSDEANFETTHRKLTAFYIDSTNHEALLATQSRAVAQFHNFPFNQEEMGTNLDYKLMLGEAFDSISADTLLQKFLTPEWKSRLVFSQQCDSNLFNLYNQFVIHDAIYSHYLKKYPPKIPIAVILPYEVKLFNCSKNLVSISDTLPISDLME